MTVRIEKSGTGSFLEVRIGKKFATHSNKDIKSSVIEEIRMNLRRNDLELYKTCFASKIRFTTMAHRMSCQKNDACILFQLGGQPAIGFIANVIRLNDDEILLRINQVSIQDQLAINLNNKRISCPNIWKGDLDSLNSFVYIRPKSIIEKLIHVYDKRCKCYFFLRIPNLCESS